MSQTEAERIAVLTAVRAVRTGDREAFGTLMDLYQRRVYALSLMMMRNPVGAEEVTQEAFVRAFTQLDRYDDTRPFYPWIATIAVRLAHTWVKRQSRDSALQAQLLATSSTQPSPSDVLEGLISDESGRELWRCVASLPQGERTVVLLYYQQEMKVSDIANALGVTDGTVKTLLFRGRKRLRHTLHPVLHDPTPEESR